MEKRLDDAPPAGDDFSRHPEAEIFAALDELGLRHETIEHAPVFSVTDRNEKIDQLEGGHTKNLFLKDKAGALMLVSAWAHSDLQLNQLHKLLGTKRLSFAKPNIMWTALRVTPGSVSAFALLHDNGQRVRFIVDEKLLEYETLHFHPMRNDMTTTLPRADFETFVQAMGRELETVDFTQLGGAETPAK